MTRRRGLTLAAAAALALFGCIQQPRGDPALPDGPIAITARAEPFHTQNPEVSRAGRLVFRGALALSSDDPRFGGLSALHVSADGARMIAITDKGHAIEARLRYDAGGRLAGVGAARIRALRDMAGRTVVGTAGHDAEALAASTDGFAVAFEGEHRIWFYPGRDRPFAAPPQPVPRPPGLEDAPRNGGIEALALLADGRMVAITQNLKAGRKRARGWIGAPSRPGGAWQPFAWRRHGKFEVSDAAGLADGALLALERRFTMVGGFAIRLVRVPAAALRADATVEGEELARIEPPYLTDNFEGLAVRRGARGETLVYLLSDDNFHPLQKTLLVMLALAR